MVFRQAGRNALSGAVILSLLSVAIPALAVTRDEEPVTLVGSAIAEMSGESINDFGLFRYDPGTTSFVPVPYQVDERVIHFFTGFPPFDPDFSQDIYDVFREDDGSFDELDEVVFLFADAGPQEPGGTPWPAGAEGRRYEIRVSDPRPVNPEADRFVYLFTGAGLAQSPVSYVTWGRRVGDPVMTDMMTIDYSGRWLLTSYSVTACGNGVDLIDRIKARAGLAPETAESEELWDQSSEYIGSGGAQRGIVGPIRAIRYVRGAGSGINTIHYDRIYRGMWHRKVDLRVHSLNSIWHYLDWLPQAGMTMYTPTKTGGVAVDGAPDGPLYGPMEDWELVRGPGGGMVYLYDIPPSPFFGSLNQYLRDDSGYNDAPANPPGYSDDDDSAYGNHGWRMISVLDTGTGSIPVSMKFFSLCADTGDATLGAEYRELQDFPLASTPTVQRLSTGVVDLSLTKTVDVPSPTVGDSVVFTTTVANAAGFDGATGVVVIDRLPSGYRYQSDDGGGTYDSTTGVWSVGAIPAGGSATLNVTAKVRGTGDYLNEAEVVTADQNDTDDTYADGAGEEYGSVTTTPAVRIDLSLTKTVDALTPGIGANVTFTITVTNDADFNHATGVTVTDLLPSGYTYLLDDSFFTGTSYDFATGLWTIGTLSAGDSIALGLTATVNPSGDYNNIAEVTAADQTDFDSTPNNGVPTEDDYDEQATTPVPAEIDLSLTKTVDNPTPDVGTNVVFTLTVSNAGPNPATGVEVVDQLPDGYLYVSDDGGGAYSPGPGIWTVGNVAAAGSQQLKITATVRGTGIYLNEAEVTAADQPDGDSTPDNGVTLEDDYASAGTSPNPVIDLSLTKTVNEPAAPVGTDVIFTLTLTNAPDFSDGTGVAVSDPLPTGFTYVSDNSATTGTSYNPTTGLWNVGPLAGGASAALQITATVNPSGDYTNVAEVFAANQPDPDSTPNNGVTTEDDYATATVDPGASADLSLTKTVDNPTPDVGSNVVFTLTLSNAGPSSATGVVVRDALPSGYTYVSDDGGGAYDPGTALWTVGTVPSSGSEVLNVTARVEPSGDYVNVAEVIDTDQADPDSTPNNGVTTEDDYDTATTTPSAVADLSLTKTVDNSTPEIGANVVFTVTLSCATGFSDSSGAQVTDLLPSGYIYVSDDSATTGTTYTPGTGLWDVGALAAGQSVALNITASVNGTGDHTNVAEVTAASEPDPDSTPNNGVTTEDDYATASTTPRQEADLSLTKTVDDPAPAVGANVVFTLTVSNAGPNDAFGVQVTDLLPSGYNYVSDDGAGAYDPGTGVWTVGSVTNGGSAVLNITAAARGSGDHVNVAEITAANETDPDSTPNNGVPAEDDQASASTAPTTRVDLSLTKTADNPGAQVGTNVVFTVTVSNHVDFSDATGVQATDLLPSGFTYVSDDGGGAYTPGTGVWVVGGLTAGSNAVLNITATVNASGDFTNVAEVTAANEVDIDSTPNNAVPTEDDYDTAAVNPGDQADLSLTHTVDNPTPDVQTDVVFTVTVTNNGPGTAGGVAATYFRQTGYAYVSDDAGGAYDPVTGLWTIGTLPSSSSAVLNLTLRVLGTGIYSNVAELASSDLPDPDSTPGNNDPTEDDYAEQATTPNPLIDLSLTKVVDDPTPADRDLVVFTLTVTNAAGYSNATGVQVLDSLPDGYNYESDDGNGAYDPSSGRWTINQVPAGGSVALNIIAEVDKDKDLLNIAQVRAADQPDIDSTPNNGVRTEDDYAEQNVDVDGTAEADLSLTKTVDDDMPNVGANVVFTLTVSNAGPDRATGVEAIDLLPSGYTHVSDDSAGEYDPGTGTWDLGTVAVGGNETLNITATVNASGDYLNKAEITRSFQIDPDSVVNNGVITDDDYAEQGTTPVAGSQADLSLAKTVDNPTPNVGSNVVFTLTVSNAGPDPASGVEVTDLLPSGYTYVSDDGAGAYVPGTGVWTVGGVAVSGNATLNITATVNGSGDYLNVAEVTAASEVDPDSTPNNGATGEDDYAQQATTPGAAIDLSLTKVVDDPGPPFGANVVFTVTASNAAGFSDATNVDVTDLLPSGYTYVSDDSASSGTVYVPGTGLWMAGTVTAGNSVALNITATVNTTGDYTNVAEVTAADQPDHDDVFGDGMGADHDTARTLPGTILTLRVRREMQDVVLSWDAFAGATSYRIYASEFPDLPIENWTLLAEIPGLEYRDVGAATLAEDRYYTVVQVGN